MRQLLNSKIVQQNGSCAICLEEFTDYHDVVPDHKEPKGMEGAWRDDHPRVSCHSGLMDFAGSGWIREC